MRNSVFLGPDEKNYKGSALLFKALHEQMIDGELAAICRVSMRSNQPPILAALIAQDEQCPTDHIRADTYSPPHSNALCMHAPRTHKHTHKCTGATTCLAHSCDLRGCS